MKQVSTTEYVETKRKDMDCSPFEGEQEEIDTKGLYQIFAYAHHQQSKLTLGMLIPCDDDGNVLNKPDPKNFDDERWDYQSADSQYMGAKERVLYRCIDLECVGRMIRVYKSGVLMMQFPKGSFPNRSVESTVNWNLEFTDDAVKRLGI